MNIQNELSNEFCLIDEKTFQLVINTQGIFFEKLSKIDKVKISKDLLNAIKPIRQAEILEKYCFLNGKKVLEIGSGFGINHIVWSKKYSIDGYGIEPSDAGFESSYHISRRLVELNGLEANKVINSKGENLPFPDEFFDIIYSTNVLEHTENPYSVLDEALRVLKTGGTLQFVYPNFLSYFDGHYAIFHPPIFNKQFFLWLIKTVYKRDSKFAFTIKTELNPLWTKRAINKLKNKYNLKIISFGEDVFMDRISTLNFDTWAGVYKIKRILKVLQRLKINKILGIFLLATFGYSPIILTIKKI